MQDIIALQWNSGLVVIKGHKTQIGLVHLEVKLKEMHDQWVILWFLARPHCALQLWKELLPSHIGMKLHLDNKFCRIFIQSNSNIMDVSGSYSTW